MHRQKPRRKQVAIIRLDSGELKENIKIEIRDKGKLIGILDFANGNVAYQDLLEKEFIPKTKGYYFDQKRGKFRVQVTIDGKRKTVGTYDTEQEAEKVYLALKKKEVSAKHGRKKNPPI